MNAFVGRVDVTGAALYHQTSFVTAQINLNDGLFNLGDHSGGR